MNTLIATIKPRSAFGGAIRGDTLFGQLCWAIMHREGASRLDALLEGYTQGAPFLVVSDAFPTGYLPRPALPLHRYNEAPGKDRKQLRQCRWLPREHFARPIADWLQYAVNESQLHTDGVSKSCNQPHNTINRMTGTTGAGEFAPYVMPQHWHGDSLRLELYIAHDPQRITLDEIRQTISDVGDYGYGRDASIGLGKFDLVDCAEKDWPGQANANGWMTLAPCAPQGQNFNAENSWYQPFTRFGRHGDIAVHTGKPFKNPVLMADTGALLQPQNWQDARFCGQGLGGDGSLSKAIAQTVHQAYAPVLAINMEQA